MDEARTDLPEQVCTFWIGDALCGVDIRRVQEINRQVEATPVPLAPDYVVGVMNLRGRVVTVMDPARKLGLGDTAPGEETRNVIVQSGEEPVGLLVDRVADVVEVDPAALAPPPANLGGIRGAVFLGVLRTDGALVGILDVDAVLEEAE
ncbi:chemotaxis protein CheW [Deferrisoma sp.]